MVVPKQTEQHTCQHRTYTSMLHFKVKNVENLCNYLQKFTGIENLGVVLILNIW